MEEIYANPVEVVKKDIYIITNTINNKCYIGQTKNPSIRFSQHCRQSNLSNSEIGKAIKKYGKGNFTFKVLERQVSNADEREKYWIKRCNTLVPNGYNVQEGGSNPPTMYGDDSPVHVISDEDVKKIKEDLRGTKLPYNALAKKYGVSKRQVLRINQGVNRCVKAEEYPIRKIPNINGKLTDDDVLEIIELLKNSYLFNGEIARRFGVEVHAIVRINNGETHRIKGVSYPIRNWKSSGVILFTYDQVTEIIDLLNNSTMSMNQIAKKYNVNVCSILGINSGATKKYRRENIIYPIRNY